MEGVINLTETQLGGHVNGNVNEFEYIHLADIDPNFSPIDEGVYTLKLIKLEYRQPKSGGNTYISGQFAVTGDNKYTGRRLFHTFFSNDFDKRTLRRIADNTGVLQQPTESFGSWMERISTTQPVFRVFVEKGPQTKWNKEKQVREAVTDDYGKEVVTNNIRWKDIGPAE